MKIQANAAKLKALLKGSSSSSASCNWTEHMPEFLDAHHDFLRKYFNVVKNHDDCEPREYGLYVYTVMRISTVVTEVITLTPEELGCSINASSVCWDFVGQGRQGNGVSNPIPSIQFNFQARSYSIPIVAMWFPTLHTLATADFTHFPPHFPPSDGHTLLKALLDYLVAHGHLQPRPNVEQVTNFWKPSDTSKPKVKEEKIEMPKITFGCDPEFELMKGGKVISLSSGSPYKGISQSTSAKVGADGAGCQVEVRPGVADSPQELIEKIRTAFESIGKDAQLSSIGDQFPLGGHIHIGFGKALRPNTDMVQLLDHFVGKPTYKMNGKARGGYSGLSQYEGKSYGFEYRTPPAAIFTNPRMAYITLKLVRGVLARYFGGRVFELLNGSEGATHEELVKYGKLTGPQADYFLGFASKFRETITYRENMLAYWVKGVGNKTQAGKPPKFDVRFSENDSFSSVIQEKIIAKLEEIPFAKSAKRGIPIHFYGLMPRRGYVVTGFSDSCFPMRDGTISVPVPLDSRYFGMKNAIGLPKHFRIGGWDVARTDKLIECIVQTVKDTMLS